MPNLGDASQHESTCPPQKIQGDPAARPPRAPQPLALIADDDQPIGEAIALILEDVGLRTVITAHGVDAVEAARQEWPDLLVSDLMMPRLDGLGVIRQLQALAQATGRPMPRVILMTAGKIRSLEGLSIDAVIYKPFDLSDFELVVRRLLRAPEER